MKKIIYLSAIALIMASCKTEPKDYVTFSGKINNPNSDSLVISNPQVGYTKKITVSENGTFKDTLNVKSNYYSVFDGKEYATVYLKNGDDIKMTLDAKEYGETLTFKGEGAEESAFLAKSALIQEELFLDKKIFALPKAEFDAKIDNFISDFTKRLNNKKLDSAFVASQKQGIQGLKPMMNQQYAQNSYIAKNLAKGTTSPKFVNYENYKGGTTSLDDLKGKYVYIDLWATWCPPCLAEIPSMKKVEKQYHGKNIEFVSISVDRKKDYEAWKKMVKDKEMTGTQLYYKEDKKFMSDYQVTGIPRFILLDPNGNIVDANAPRPSDPKLIELLNSLKI